MAILPNISLCSKINHWNIKHMLVINFLHASILNKIFYLWTDAIECFLRIRVWRCSRLPVFLNTDKKRMGIFLLD